MVRLKPRTAAASISEFAYIVAVAYIGQFQAFKCPLFFQQCHGIGEGLAGMPQVAQPLMTGIELFMANASSVS